MFVGESKPICNAIHNCVITLLYKLTMMHVVTQVYPFTRQDYWTILFFDASYNHKNI